MSKELLSKLALARAFVKAKKLSKDGTNEYSKYNYFTPEFVESIVTEACNEVNIMCLFNLECDQFGYFGEVLTFDLETGDSIRSVIRTEKPNITATNATQQMGGMNTYTKRYAFMSLFGIEDNTIDFDAQDNRPSTQKPKEEKPADDRPWLNKFKGDKKTITDEWVNVTKALAEKKCTMQYVESRYKINKELKSELQSIK